MSCSVWSVIKHWKRWPSRSPNARRAGVWALPAADQPGSIGPVGEVDLAGQLRDPRSVTRLAVLGCRRLPRRFLKAKCSGSEVRRRIRRSGGLGDRSLELMCEAVEVGAGELPLEGAAICS
jgi:hypothetical protein